MYIKRNFRFRVDAHDPSDGKIIFNKYFSSIYDAEKFIKEFYKKENKSLQCDILIERKDSVSNNGMIVPLQKKKIFEFNVLDGIFTEIY